MAFTQLPTGGGVPNVDFITQTLAKLQPDSALQNYARMHKNDPYILSLATAESNRRKALRTAAQGQVGQQPTVVDQNIAGMAPAPVMTGAGVPLQTGYGGPVMTGMASGGLPEDQGIAQIPTPNIQRMADGGIAGYEDDEEGMATGGMGGMFNFAQQSEPVVRMSGGGVPGYAAGVFNKERFREFLKAKNIDEKAFSALDFSEKEKLLKDFGNTTSGPQKAASTPKAAAPAATTPAASTAAPTKEGALYKPAKAAGEAVKYGKGALKGIPYISGGIGAYQGISDLKNADGFYNDPNVPTLEKAKQAGLTTLKAGLPIAGTAVGSLFTPAGAFVGGAAGTAASEYLDLETDALKAWKKANPQATPEQAQKAAVALAPAYDGPKLNAAQAERATTGQPTITAVPEAKPAVDAGGLKDLLPAVPKFDTEYKPATAPTAADAKAKAAELYDSKGQKLSLEQKRLQAREDIFGEKRERLAQLEAFNKEQGPAFASYEKMLQKEELQDTTDKEKAGLMSLMKGFLAMAAGESPNAATNIAKGAMVGMGDYGDALKEFKKAAKERTKAMADIENARRAEAKGDFRDMRTFEDRANERLAASDDRFTGLISQITGKESDVAASLLNNMTNNAEETSRMMFKESTANKRFMAEQIAANARASMQVNAPGATERLVDRMARDPKFAASYRDFASIGPEAKGIAGIAAKMVGNPAAMMMLKQQDPVLHDQVAAYIKQMALTPQAGAGSRD
jgi:hypothetical protein